ncbi:MAG: alpha/beta fold hydrolase [Planctomycetota bacterium]
MTDPAISLDSFADLYPFSSQYHSVVGNHQLHYLDEGSGEPIVMVHGNPTWSFFFRHLILALRSQYRVVVPDHLGCGLSDKPQNYPYRLKNHIENLESLLETLKFPQKITLVMHDWGGCIGMGYASKYPEKIGRLIFMNTATFRFQHVKHFPKAILLNRIPGFGEFSIRVCNTFVKSATFMAMTHKSRMNRKIRAGFHAPYNSYENRIAVHRFVQDIPLDSSHPTYPVVEAIENALPQFNATPKLFCWGWRDFCFNPSVLQAWKHFYPEAEYEIYLDANHYLLEDAHERIVPRIDKFLQKYPLSRNPQI